jgi:hypothetical protein
MDVANIKQAAIQDLWKAIRWRTTDGHSLYYEDSAERVRVETRFNYFDVNVSGDSVLAMISHVADAFREHEGSRG